MRLFITFRKITLSLIALINVIVVVIMLICAWAGHISPARHPICEVISLGFPIPLAINLFFLVFWLLVSVRYALISLVGLLLCFNSVRDFCPFNFPGDQSECQLKVLSFNLNNYNGSTKSDSDYIAITKYIIDSGADIVCMQESQIGNKKFQNVISSMLENVYPYRRDDRKPGHVKQSFYSKYPIRWAKDVPFETDPRMPKDGSKNSSMVYCLSMGEDTLLVFNCHLASQRFVSKEKNELQDFVERKTDRFDEKPLFSKIMTSGEERALQADFLSRTLKKHADASVVLCGDFNSSPTSYAHHAIAKRLTDCYRQAGNGVGFSYSHYGMYVRIDHIFCSDDWVPVSCEIDKNFTVSDHLPAICCLKKRPKP